MVLPTFIAHGIGFCEPSELTVYGANIATAAGPKYNALFSLFNSDTDVNSGRLIKVLRFSARPVAPGYIGYTATAVCAGGFALCKITAASDGYLWTANKMATANSSPPSQIEVRTFSDATIGSIIRPYAPFTADLTIANGLALFTHFKDSSFYKQSIGDSNNQPITLAEGEGICISQLDPNNYNQGSYYCDVTIRIGSSLYNYVTEIAPTAPISSSISVMNKTGSGVTVEVLEIKLFQVGPWTFANTSALAPTATTSGNEELRFTAIKGISGGQTVTPDRIGLDSVPNFVDVRQCRLGSTLTPIFLSDDNSNTAAFSATNTTGDRNKDCFLRFHVMQGVCTSDSGGWPGLGRGHAFAGNGAYRGKKYYAQNCPGIVLTPQSGVCVGMYSSHAFSHYYWEIEFATDFQNFKGSGLLNGGLG